MGEEQEETGRGPTPRAAYARAMRAEEKAQKALEELSEIKSALNDLINALKTHNAPTTPPTPIQAQSLRPGSMIHNVIAEDDEGVTEEIICPTCGTREVRKVPTKVQIKEKEIVPDNYVPAPRSISEALQLLESLRLSDGRTVFESDRFWDKLNELASKYRRKR
jgi:hypothetical protein